MSSLDVTYLDAESVDEDFAAEKYSVLLSDFVQDNEEPNEESSDDTG